VSDAASRALDEQGFTIIPAVFSNEFLDHAMHEIHELGPSRSRAGIRHALHLEPVTKMARLPQLLGIAAAVLGPAAFPFGATLFEKTPATNWLVVWHQDTALPLRKMEEIEGWGPWSVKDGIRYAHAPACALGQVLALRIHFDDSTHDNGPLRVLPATHCHGVLSDDEIHELSTRIPPVDCQVPKGGVVAMRPLLVHASSKLRNASPRRVLHVEYAASDSIASPLQLALA
jgi:hypothetical protein